jgi:hypothetical protein
MTCSSEAYLPTSVQWYRGAALAFSDTPSQNRRMNLDPIPMLTNAIGPSMGPELLLTRQVSPDLRPGVQAAGFQRATVALRTDL